MNSVRIVFSMARADFLERVRRYSFLFTLGLALYFGYLASTGRLTIRVGDLRGVCNSAWVGALLAMVGSTFISLAGFYFVKNAIQRDRETRVGQILAATPISRFLYILSKVTSNFSVLSLMIVILALSAFAMQLLRGEDTHILVWPLLSPFFFIAIPAMAVIAALAVTFETIPILRGGVGNIAYFFLWTAILSASVATRSHTFDLSGFELIRESTTAAAHLPLESSGFSLSLDFGQFAASKGIFHWDGVSWTPELILTRFALFGAALVFCLIATLFFDRFDPARRALLSTISPRNNELSPTALSLPVASPSVIRLTPLVASRKHSRFGGILIAELRLLLKGQKWWWYVVAGGLIIASAATPDASARGIVLALAWIWPVLLWSSLGVRESREQTHQLLFSAPHPISRQLPALWLAGVILALLTGSGFAVRLLLQGNGQAFFAWLVGALFIPTSALCLGVWSGSSKPFEILYTLLWYLGPMHEFPTLDFMGSAPAIVATHYPLFYLFLTVIFAAAAFAGRRFQLSRG